ncbi:zinc-dependent metalloprotease family protein [Aquimarina gracilis]|uniref:Zinc-dependent metalloprotease family protein n=1 Tax=Aquimarina gracilis TaxID=874422 RepID=A0ABU5ZZM2_9FLAO|nr:zinc-dependent metalloprotease family protein [Aquimarina gracilis]MEB3347287.1 zinc-dependent metalloprotease family protein [Aquimarina gracilis]
MKKLIILFSAWTLVSLYFDPITAQHTIESSSITIQQKNKNQLQQKIKTYTLFEINLNELNRILKNEKSSSINLKIGNTRSFDMLLQENEIRSETYQEFESSENTKRQLPKKSTVNTYSGTLRNGKMVRLTVTHDFIYGIIEVDSGFMVIDQLRYYLSDKRLSPNKLILYNINDLIEKEGFCSTVDTAEKIEHNIKNNNTEKITTDCQILEVATDADFEYFSTYGANANTRILAEFNNIQGVYANTFALEMVIVFQNVWTTVADPYVSTNAATITNEVINTWQNNFGNVNRDLVEMFTDKNLGSLLGRASGIGTICRQSSSSSYTVDRFAAFRTLGHEIGHNFGGIHGDGVLCGGSTASVMCQGDKQIPIYFSNNSINRINNYINSNSGCLFQFNNISITGESLICSSSTQNYTLTSELPGTITWSVSSGALTIIGGQGTPTVTIRGFSGDGNATLTASVEVNGALCGAQTISKAITIGQPIDEIYFTNGIGDEGYFCTSHYGNEFEILPRIPNTSYQIRLLNWPALNVVYSPSGTFSNTGTISYTPYPQGFYVFEARAINSCGTGDWVGYEVEYTDCSQGPGGGGEEFAFYPNPSSGEIFIERKNDNDSSAEISNLEVSSSYPNNEPIRIEIYTIFGQLVTSKAYHESQSALRFDISNLKKGNYFVKIMYVNSNEVHQLIVEN